MGLLVNLSDWPGPRALPAHCTSLATHGPRHGLQPWGPSQDTSLQQLLIDDTTAPLPNDILPPNPSCLGIPAQPPGGSAQEPSPSQQQSCLAAHTPSHLSPHTSPLTCPLKTVFSRL